MAMSLRCTLPFCSSLCQLHPDQVRSRSIDIHQPKKATEPKADNEVGTEIESGRAGYTSSSEQGAPFNVMGVHGWPAIASGGRRHRSALFPELVGGS